MNQALRWIRSDFKLKRLNGFVSYKHTLSLTSQDVHWWTGVALITCELLYVLFELSLMAHIHRRGFIGEQTMQC